ncbi:MFS transporter [Polymorphobacter fuscus]|nr:MFS transporter [Polymorphobacter fuscus]NJC07208.1 ACS family hexuronate transporter-like MFS transporter [Polymorphobacter fuscus]
MTAAGRRLLVGLLFVAIALNYVDRQVLSLLKPTLEAEFGWTSSDYAHLGSAFQIAAASALLLVGWFVDRVGVRLALGLGVVLWSLAGMAHAFAGSVQQFVAARVALAVAESVGTPAAVKTAAVYLPLRQRSFALGLFNTAPNIGAILTPLLIPPLALAFGWRAAFLVTGGLGLVWAIFWIIGTRRLRPVEAVTAATPKAAGWGMLLRARSSWTIIGAKALSDLVWWFVLFWTPDFFHREFGLEQGALGYPIVLIFSFAAAGALSSGWLFPKLVDSGLSINAARKRSMLFYALLIVPIPLALLTQSAWVAALLIGVGLFAHQGISTNIFGLSTDIVPASGIARVIAMGAVAGNISGSLIIELAGWSIDNGHGYWPMFAICAVAYLLALAFIQLMLPVIRPVNPLDERPAA